MKTNSGKVVSHCRAIRTLFSKNICQWRLLYRGSFTIENKEETKIEVTQRSKREYRRTPGSRQVPREKNVQFSLHEKKG